MFIYVYLLTCNPSRVSFANQCAGVYGGPGNNTNPDSSVVLTALNDDNLFGDINDWKFDRRDQTSNPFGPNSLGLTLNGLGATSGTFSFSNIGSTYTNLVIGLKAGTNYALYFIPKGTYSNNTIFSWSTADFSVGQGQGQGQTPGLSNFNVFYQVPTPAMLPGLVGMGLAALRKKKEQNDQDDDSTL